MAETIITTEYSEEMQRKTTHLFVQCIKKFTGHIMYREVSYGTEKIGRAHV